MVIRRIRLKEEREIQFSRTIISENMSDCGDYVKWNRQCTKRTIISFQETAAGGKSPVESLCIEAPELPAAPLLNDSTAYPE